jgi:hypothetical protein
MSRRTPGWQILAFSSALKLCYSFIAYATITHVLGELPNIFSDNGRKKEQQDNEKLQAELYQQIGKLKVELDWVKKKAGMLS